MKPLVHSLSLVILVFLFIGAVPPPAQPVISGMTIDGDSVVLTAEMPAGFSRAILQTRASLDSSWENGMETPAPITGGPVKFRFPRRAEMLFMRIAAFSADAQTKSSELNYLTIAPQVESIPTRNPDAKKHTNAQLVATLHFKAFIDGFDTIHVGREGILWNHLQYKLVYEVSLNGRSWNPAEMNFIDLGTNLAQQNISWEDCQIEVISGRDIVALEKQNDGALVHIYDTPWGADEYEFKVNLFAAPKKISRKNTAAHLHIRANIDGSDELIVNAKEARWTHKQWDWPFEIEMNGAAWDAKENPIWKKSLLPAGVDFRNARVVSKSGRGFANVEARKDELLVSFADDMDGAATYDLEIVFGE